ncbi:DUF945 family protein [Pseudoduganella sp. HUAS MS19]
MAKPYFIWTLLALSPLAFAEPAEPAESPKPAETASLAADYVKRELGSRLTVRHGKSIQPDKASKNSYPPEQMAAVRAVFGSEDPLVVKRQPAAAGRISYSMSLPARQYTDGQSTMDWAQANLNLAVAPNGSQQFSASLPFVRYSDGEDRIELSGVRSSGTVAADPLVGKTSLEIGKVRFAPVGGEETGFTIDDIRYRSDSKREGKYVGSRTEIAFGRSSAFGHAIDNLHLGLRLRKLDAGAIAGLKGELEQARTAGDAERETGDVLTRLVPLMKRLVMRGAALEIEDLSGSYNGQKVVIKGSLSMPHAAEEDFASGAAALKKLQGRLEVAIPLQLLREIAYSVAVHHNGKNEGQQVPVDKMAAQIYETMLGKAIANNYARLDKQFLRTTIELKGGLLAINGTAMPLEPLLALLEHQKPLPADTQQPVVISMRDRGLEAAQLFAMNGNPEGMLELCERLAQGNEVDKDPQQASKWCTRAWEHHRYQAPLPLARLYLDGQLDDPAIPRMLQEAADKHDVDAAQFLMYRLHSEGKGVPKDQQKAAGYLQRSARHGYKKAIEAMKETDAGDQAAPAVPVQAAVEGQWDFSFVTDAGFYEILDFRFDAAKHRRLSLSIDNLQEHEKWGPLLSLCVSAINPSDRACVNLGGRQGEVPQVEVSSKVAGTQSAQGRNEKSLEKRYKPGDKLDLVVYTTGKQVHFVVNGDTSLVQEVDFPVEVLSIICSTANCNFNFQRPD